MPGNLMKQKVQFLNAEPAQIEAFETISGRSNFENGKLLKSQKVFFKRLISAFIKPKHNKN